MLTFTKCNLVFTAGNSVQIMCFSQHTDTGSGTKGKTNQQEFIRTHCVKYITSNPYLCSHSQKQKTYPSRYTHYCDPLTRSPPRRHPTTVQRCNLAETHHIDVSMSSPVNGSDKVVKIITIDQHTAKFQTSLSDIQTMFSGPIAVI